MKIVVIGSSNTDLIVRIPRIPRPGETVLGGRFMTAAGGKGANQAIAAARAGGEVSFIACLGNDDLGDEALCGFRKDGLDTSHIFRESSPPSGVALIFVGDGGENSIAVAGGANMSLTPEKIRDRRRVIESSDILVAQLEIPLESVELAAQIAADKGIPVLLDPAPAQALPDSLLQQVSILTPNETEAEILTGITVTDAGSARNAASALRNRGVGTVIVTMGSRGVYVSSEALEEMVPGFSIEAVDTTAAGDVFTGALSVAFAEGLPLDQSVRFASAAAALSVTREGAQPSVPRREEIENFLQAH